MSKIIFIFLFVGLLSTVCFSANVNRIKRGFLSRTGVCPEPSRNFQKRDRRLNYFGNAIVVKKGGNKDVTCVESECVEDSHCDADKKCCKNRCGGMVCTRSVRDPDPCSNFACPTDQSCKIQRVKCVMPECKDTYALNRPTCVPTSEATVLLNDDNRIGTPRPAGETTTQAALASASYGGSYGNGQQPYYGNYQQSYYNNNQQTSGTNNYAAASSPQASYYTANQQVGNNYGQQPQNNWQQNNYQQQG